jgi:hypothetical protein
MICVVGDKGNFKMERSYALHSSTFQQQSPWLNRLRVGNGTARETSAVARHVTTLFVVERHFFARLVWHHQKWAAVDLAKQNSNRQEL